MFALLADFVGLDVRPSCLTAPAKIEADTRQDYKVFGEIQNQKILTSLFGLIK